MISGRIKIHTEPERYRQRNNGWTRSNPHGYSGYGNDDDSNAYSWMREAYRNSRNVKTEQDLLLAINKATCNGFIEGSRVRRASGNPGSGTITRIIRILGEALDEDTNDLSPFRVTWDVTPSWPAGGSFNYSEDELVLLSSPIEPSKGNNHETVPNLSIID